MFLPNFNGSHRYNPEDANKADARTPGFDIVCTRNQLSIQEKAATKSLCNKVQTLKEKTHTPPILKMRREAGKRGLMQCNDGVERTNNR